MSVFINIFYRKELTIARIKSGVRFPIMRTQSVFEREGRALERGGREGEGEEEVFSFNQNLAIFSANFTAALATSSTVKHLKKKN